MKNLKLFHLLTLSLIFSLTTTSCSDDDDDNNSNSDSNIELYINNVKQSVYTGSDIISLPSIIYSNNEFQFSALIGNIERDELIMLNFEDISFKDLVVGDDLATKTSWAEYTLFYKGDFYSLFDYHPVLTSTQYNEYKGQAIVKELDKSKGTIKVEFSNIKIPTFDAGNPYKQPEKTVTVKAMFSGEIDFD